MVGQPSKRLPASGVATQRVMADAINRALAGQLDCVDELTLAAGAASTVIDDPRAHAASVILLCPLTANAAGALASTYVSSRGTRTFTLAHANNAQTDRRFAYAVVG